MFDGRKSRDQLYLWSKLRNSRLETANHAAASDINIRRLRVSMWGWASNMGMFGFVPGVGHIQSPFGYWLYGPSDSWTRPVK